MYLLGTDKGTDRLCVPLIIFILTESIYFVTNKFNFFTNNLKKMQGMQRIIY